MSTGLIIVADTQVLLDCWVFEDPRCQPLQPLWSHPDVTWLGSSACQEEWVRVLGYARLKLDPAQQRALRARYDGLIRCHAVALREGPSLPRCRDPDDQKFVELAVAGEAHWLLSRDAALLALAGPLRRRFGIEVLTPQQACTPGAPGWDRLSTPPGSG